MSYCNTCGKWNGAAAVPAGANTDHLCRCPTRAHLRILQAVPLAEERVREIVRDELAKANAADGVLEDGWLPISTAPRDGTNILLAWGQDGVSQGHYVSGLQGAHPWKFIDTNDGITWLINHAVDGPGGPTHWMPMPKLTLGVATAQPLPASGGDKEKT